MLQKYSLWIVAGVFFNEPSRKHYLIEISKKAGIAHTSVKNCLSELKRLRVIDESFEKKGSRMFPIYSANINSSDYRFYKNLYNIDLLRRSKIIDFLRDALMPSCIVLFGSFFRGEDRENSDIDLFVECVKKNIDVSKYEKKLNRNVQIHFKNEFNDFPEELKNNIINGVVLYGYLEVYK